MKKILLGFIIIFGLFPITSMGKICTDFDENQNLIEYECGTQSPAKNTGVDKVDAKGNTELCNAILNDDIETYNALKAKGANPEHQCVKKISSEKYKSFIEKTLSTNKSLSFISLGNVGWGVLGVGALAGLGAVAMSGGGGSSNSGDSNSSAVNDNNSNMDNPNAICSGYDYTSASQCPVGYTLGSHCITGSITKYKCDKEYQCPYSTTECNDGYVETESICYSGNKKYKQCKPASCDGFQQSCSEGWEHGTTCKSGETTLYKCDVPSACYGYEASCSTGYIPIVGDTCKSGNDILVSCELDSEHYIEQDGTAFWKLNCVHGEQNHDNCVCENGYIGTLCDTFDYVNYFMDPSDNQIYDKLNCVHGTQSGNTCNCVDGWTGTLCDIFDYVNYFMDPADNQIYDKLNCVHGTQSGNTCNCADGWTGTLCDIFDYVNYFMDPADNQIYDKLNCVHGTQSGNTCTCDEGWTGTLCDAVVNCGIEYKASCVFGYIETNTCKSGNDILVNCELDSEHYIEQDGTAFWKLNCVHGEQNHDNCVCENGYIGTLCDTFDYVNYFMDPSDNQIYDKLNCVHGTQSGNTCNCADGWTGTLCDTPVTCPSNYKTECTGGYEPAGIEPCQSGDSVLVGCKQIQCGANASWSASGCLCRYGYENWQAGVGCELIPLVCGVDAHQDGVKCVCDAGYINWTENHGCYPMLNCGINAYQNGNECVCNDGYTNYTPGTGCYPINCGVNAHQNGVVCECDSGYTDWKNGYGCHVMLDCGVHSYQNGDVCECEPGYDNWIDGVGCSVYGINDTVNTIISTDTSDLIGLQIYPYHSNNSNLYITKTNNGNVYGLKSSSSDPANMNIFNALDDTGVLNIDKIGNGSIYGMLSCSYGGNAKSREHRGAKGYIVINNDGDGNVMGISSDGVQNATGNGQVLGVINITNINNANGNIIGMQGSGLRNVSAELDAESNICGIIKITNFGSNNVYGLLGSDLTNVSTVSVGIQGTVHGLIDIKNDGNGDVYGLTGYNDVYNTSYDYLNGDVVGGAEVVVGNIRIDNQGSGNAYGMYGGYLVNAEGGTGIITVINRGNGNAYGMHSSGSSNSSYVQNGHGTSIANSKGIINLVNYSDGEVFGMYGKQIYNETGVNRNGAMYLSEINIQNLAGGTATGLHVYKPDGSNTGSFVNEVSATNSGIININNLGTGSVFGIYNNEANNGYSEVTNDSGVINITRNSYIDEDNVLYEPNGIAGDVYGIYAKGSLVLNNGTINITSNGNMYGVYAENYYAGNSFDIKMTSLGNGSVYGMYVIHNNASSFQDKGNIEIVNYGSGNAYGIYSVVTNNNSDYIVGKTRIVMHNRGTGNMYGLYGTKYSTLIPLVTSKNVMEIINYSTGNVYGVYVTNVAIGASGGFAPIEIQNLSEGTAIGKYLVSSSQYSSDVNINNIGTGTAIGMFVEGDLLAYNTGTINITRDSYTDPLDNAIIYNPTGTAGDVFGIYAGSDGVTANYGTIDIKSNGNIYGMYSISGTVASESKNGGGFIKITNNGIGNAYGMYGKDVYNETYGQTTSEINIENVSNGRAYGMYATNTATNSCDITINNIGTGSAYGIFGEEESTITNSGTINITRDSYIDPLDNTIVYEPTGTSGNVFGIYAQSNSTVDNFGDINITTNGNAYGIYVESGSTVTNTGTISITTSGTAYGIYAEGNSTVTNSGTITLNGVSCDGTTCDGSSSYGNHIVLNGSSLLNKGIMSAPQMNLNSMGGNVVAGLGSQFVVDNELSGDLNISSDVVMDGNQTTYVANNMIDAADISKLNVRSASAMFDATIADNKHDIVMQMKDFNELTDNASLAQFLADNYAKGNGNDLFAALKSLENMSAFNGALAGLTGLDTFTQFAHEDLSAMREISFSMNNKLFENSGRDSFDISDSTGYFSFSNSRNGGSGQYGISSNKITDNLKLGYGMAMANINTGDDNGMHRQNKMWLFYMPATYTNDGYELVVAPKAGFARSEYNRRGYNNMNYEGYIEKRIFGLMNDLRYPLNFGNWTIAPDLAFNAIVYDQSGHEDEQEFSLIIPDDRTVSVETGLGLYTKYEKTLQDGGRFKLNSGLMVYREFGDTYDIKLGMRGMDGTFSLYNNDYEYRGAANIGFDYMAGRLHVYGNAQYFMDNDNYMNFKGGVSYRF